MLTTLLPPTAVDILTRILARDDAPVSATSRAMKVKEKILGSRPGSSWPS